MRHLKEILLFRMFPLLASLLFAACSIPMNSDRDFSNITTYTPTGQVVVNAVETNQHVQTWATLTCGTHLFVQRTGTVLQLETPVSCTASSLGEVENISIFGFPTHLDEDGTYWTGAPASARLKTDLVTPITVQLFRLFVPGTYTCTVQDYDSDTYGVSDPKATMELGPQYIFMDDQGWVTPEDDPTLGIMAEDEHLQAVGDTLILVSAESDETSSVFMSAIANDFFTMGLSLPNNSVSVLSCNLQ